MQYLKVAFVTLDCLLEYNYSAVLLASSTSMHAVDGCSGGVTGYVVRRLVNLLVPAHTVWLCRCS
jgi:hypothetical protein